MAQAKKGGLGRGLDALFAEAVPVETLEEATEDAIIGRIADTDKETGKKNKKIESSKDEVQYLGIYDIKPNKEQPRKTFDEDKLNELASSIRENGILQPIIVRPVENGYEIVAGERRFRAAMKAELTKVPCLVREYSDEQNMLFAIIENMQREDLNPIEEADGLNQMMKSYGLTQEQISKSIGKSRPYITNSLRLLKLPEYIRESIAKGEISAAHGRTLVTVRDEKKRRELMERVIRDGLSVRELERTVKTLTEKKTSKPAKAKDPNLAKVEEELKTSLGTKVNISPKGKKGKIEIEYYSKDELERLIELLKSFA